jgi:hypothetical protein
MPSRRKALRNKAAQRIVPCQALRQRGYPLLMSRLQTKEFTKYLKFHGI